MNNTSPNTEQVTTNNMGKRRLDSSRNLLGLIDAAIRAVEPKTDWVKTAPTTAKVCLALDQNAKNPAGRAAKLPPECFMQYDPFAAMPEKIGQSFQRDLGRIVQFNAATSKALIAAGARLVADATLITDDEKMQLLKIQTKMDNLKTQLSKFSTAAATTENYGQAQRRVVETLQNGALPSKPVRLLDSIHAEYAANRQALSSVLFELYHQAFPLAIKVHAKALFLIREEQAYLETREREMAENFSLPWAPSLHWKACVTIQNRIHPDRLRCAASSDSGATSSSTPRELLEGIPIEL
jgi:hypothetical protein